MLQISLRKNISKLILSNTVPAFSFGRLIGNSSGIGIGIGSSIGSNTNTNTNKYPFTIIKSKGQSQVEFQGFGDIVGRKQNQGEGELELQNGRIVQPIIEKSRGKKFFNKNTKKYNNNYTPKQQQQPLFTNKYTPPKSTQPQPQPKTQPQSSPQPQHQFPPNLTLKLALTLTPKKFQTAKRLRQTLLQLFQDTQKVILLAKTFRIIPFYFSVKNVDNLLQSEYLGEYLEYIVKKRKQKQSYSHGHGHSLSNSNIQKQEHKQHQQQYITQLKKTLTTLNLTRNHQKQRILQTYINYIKRTQDLTQNQVLMQIFDIRNPQNWFKTNSQAQRRFIYHHGPTNSGKTYSAVNQLRNLRSDQKGIYMAPLRLLAWQTQKKLGKCNLVTGQQKDYQNSNLTSCTIQAAKFTQVFDVAIVDQIQMIGDINRGWSWTTSVLGLQANKIHLCGDQRALHLVSRLIQKSGGTLQQRQYIRLSKLHLINRDFKLSDLRPGDCIIDFSSRKLYKHRQKINQIKGTPQQPCKTAIIYGKMPPMCRKDQAQKFNSGQLPYLVASDAIGMGLNLKIRRIIFLNIVKTGNQKRERILQDHQIRQIAGRAGRGYGHGYVQCANFDIRERVKYALRNVNLTIQENLNIEQGQISTQQQQKQQGIDMDIKEYQKQGNKNVFSFGGLTKFKFGEIDKQQNNRQSQSQRQNKQQDNNIAKQIISKQQAKQLSKIQNKQQNQNQNVNVNVKQQQKLPQNQTQSKNKYQSKTKTQSTQSTQSQTQPQKQLQPQAQQQFLINQSHSNIYSPFLSRYLKQDQTKIKRAGIFFPATIIQRIKIKMQRIFNRTLKTSQVIRLIIQLSKQNKQLYFVEKNQEFLQLSDSLQFLQLPFQIHYLFAQLPIPSSSNRHKQVVINYAKQFKYKGFVTIPKQILTNYLDNYSKYTMIKHIRQLEEQFLVVEGYSWLWNHYQLYFPENQLSVKIRNAICLKMNQILRLAADYSYSYGYSVRGLGVGVGRVEKQKQKQKQKQKEKENNKKQDNLKTVENINSSIHTTNPTNLDIDTNKATKDTNTNTNTNNIVNQIQKSDIIDQINLPKQQQQSQSQSQQQKQQQKQKQRQASIYKI